MTILKLIRCTVAQDKQQRFANSQLAWKRTALCDGFLGQIGGWDNTTGQAVILAFWHDYDAINNFMTHVHDQIVERNRQHRFYVSSSVDYYQISNDIKNIRQLLAQTLCLSLDMTANPKQDTEYHKNHSTTQIQGHHYQHTQLGITILFNLKQDGMPHVQLVRDWDVFPI